MLGFTANDLFAEFDLCGITWKSSIALAGAAMARDEDSDFGEDEEEYEDSEVRKMP